MDHQDAALAVQFLRDGFHGDATGFEVVRSDIAIACRLGDLIDEYERDFGGLDVIDGRGASLELARVQDDGVYLLGDEVLDLAELLLDVGLGIDHDEFHARLGLSVFDDGFRKFRGVFRGKVARGEANEDFAFLTFGWLFAARQEEAKDSQGGQHRADGQAGGRAHAYGLRTGLTAVEPNRTHDDEPLNHGLVVRRDPLQVQAVVNDADEKNAENGTSDATDPAR